MRTPNVNLYLVGFMGVGKTTVGRIVAQRLGYRLLDSDHEIERLTGKSIPDILRRTASPRSGCASGRLSRRGTRRRAVSSPVAVD